MCVSTKEITHYARLCCLLVDVGSQVLRSTFDKIHPPATLHTVLGSTSVHYATLQSLKNGRVLNPMKWGKLSQASVDDSSFSAYWQDIGEALVSLGGSHFRTKIDDLEHDYMDPVIEKHH